MKNPNRPIEHPEVVDWLTSEYPKRMGKTFRDSDRAIRKLAQEGKLVKLGKGLHKYDSDLVTNPELEDFTPAQIAQLTISVRKITSRRKREEDVYSVVQSFKI